MKKTLVALALVALAALTLSACGNQTDTTRGVGSGASTGAVFNDADVAFAQRMVPHHEQAVVMARMTTGRVHDPAVDRLARDIEAAQAPEIKQMKGWLTSWGKDVSGSTMMGDGDGSSTGMMGNHVPGMMGGNRMGMLRQMHGRDWDDMFLTMMIAHHRGAIAMAKQELDHGRFPDALALARQIITSQQQEIVTMRGLLAD